MAAAALTLVLLPGLGSRAETFENTRLQAAVPKGSRVLFIDYTDNRSVATMAASAWSQVDAALPGGGQRVVLLGYSMGGFVAQEMVCQNPGRVLGVVLVSTTAPTLAQVYADPGELRRLLQLLLSPPAGSMLNPRVLYSAAYLRSLRAAEKRQLKQRMSAGALSRDVFLTQLSAVVSLMTSGAASAALRRRCFAHVPVLVIHGEEDVLVPPRAVQALDALKGAAQSYARTTLGGAGHALLVEQPGAVNALLKPWLQALLLPPPPAPPRWR